MLAEKGDYGILDLFKDSWKLLEGNRAAYSFFIVVLSLSHSIPFILAFLLGKIVDFFSKYSSGESLILFYEYVSLIAVLGIAWAFLRRYSKMGLSKIAAKTRQKVREISMSKLVDLDLQWHENENTGSKIRKIENGSSYVYRFLSDFASNWAIPILVGIFGSIGIFFVLGWQYVVFTLLYLFIFLTIDMRFNKSLRHWEDKMNKVSEKVSGKFHESASNVLSVKSLGLREMLKRATRLGEDEYYRTWLSMKKISNTKITISQSIASIGYAGFLIIIGFDFVAGSITIGSILVFAAYFDKLRNSLDRFSDMVGYFIQTESGIERLMSILGKDVFDRESESLQNVADNWKLIEFKNVFFKYKSEGVLEGLNLKIERGKKIGIVGRSGCGKSTLGKILLGLYTPQKGDILIDGKNLEKFKHSSITSSFAPVLQDSEMFNMSLEKNISISSNKKSQKLLERAVLISELGDVIKKLPKGLSTLVGEKGYKLSGGERQRVGIARAIYRNSSLLILDEATSHLDSKTERKIQFNLEKYLEGKTVLVIAHRLSTLKGMDKILVMEKGKVVEEGDFDELIKKKGKFFELYGLQKSEGKI